MWMTYLQHFLLGPSLILSRPVFMRNNLKRWTIMFQKKTIIIFFNHNINFTENVQDAGCPGQLVYCIPLLRTVGLTSLRYFRYFLMYFRYFPIQTTKATNLLDEIKWQMDIFFQGGSCTALEKWTPFSAEDRERRVTKMWQHRAHHTDFQVYCPLATAPHSHKPKCYA